MVYTVRGRELVKEKWRIPSCNQGYSHTFKKMICDARQRKWLEWNGRNFYMRSENRDDKYFRGLVFKDL